MTSYVDPSKQKIDCRLKSRKLNDKKQSRIFSLYHIYACVSDRALI